MDNAKDKNAPKEVQKKKEPGKRCVVMFCNKTNADGVSLHKFPTDETRRRQWIAFVLAKRDDNWRQGSGHIIFVVRTFLRTATKDWVRKSPDFLQNLF